MYTGLKAHYLKYIILDMPWFRRPSEVGAAGEDFSPPFPQKKRHRQKNGGQGTQKPISLEIWTLQVPNVYQSYFHRNQAYYTNTIIIKIYYYLDQESPMDYYKYFSTSGEVL